MNALQMLVIDGGLLALGLTFKLQQLGLLAGEARRLRKGYKVPGVAVQIEPLMSAAGIAREVPSR